MPSPAMPSAAAEIWRQLGLCERLDLLSWEHCRPGALPVGTRISKGDPIFPRVDLVSLQAAAETEQAPTEAEPGKKADKKRDKEKPKVSTVSYEQFSQLDLRVGKILDVENVPEADRLYKLTVDVGEDEPRTLVAGLAEAFSPRELLDAQVVVVANLEPATIRGVQSNGMVLAAGGKVPVALVTLDRDCAPGEKVR